MHNYDPCGAISQSPRFNPTTSIFPYQPITQSIPFNVPAHQSIDDRLANIERTLNEIKTLLERISWRI
ncbi:MAG: hypothetical protein MUO73_03415 [Thermoplasmata archaeon]|nr:hypothetical protein [Thermoplasmata archaeon]